MSSSPRYYYVDAQNQAAGPIPLAELQSLHASSTIGDTTLVVLEGGQDWVAFSTIKPTPQPAPQPASSQPVASLSVSPKIAQVTATSPSLSLSSSAEPAWATQLLQKVDQLTLAAEKIVAALEKNTVPRQMPAPAPATAALHAEKISLNPIPKLGLAQATTSPASAPAPRPGVSTPLSPMAVPANAVKPSLPLPALGKPGTPTPVATPEISGNLFSKFLTK